jgi:mono/diheme cytochrome c family protein
MRLRLTWTRAGVVLAVLLLVAAGLVAWLNVAGEDPLVGDAGSFVATPEQVAHGAYLARAGNCAACHTDRGGAAFAGGKGIATPFGTVFASNLTPDARTGIGAWSAAQFWRAMHNGRSADGRLLYPAFPYPNFTEITRADSDALFSYLRSQVPVTQVNRPHALRFPYNLQASLAVWRAMFFAPGVYEPVVERSVQWNRGAYLVRSLGHCAACHSPRNAFGATRDSLEFSGGLIPLQNWYAPSLASSAEAGVADWSNADIAALLKTGLTPRGAALGPMAEVVFRSTQYLHDSDIAAMAEFLKSLPQTPPHARAAVDRQGIAGARRGALQGPLRRLPWRERRGRQRPERRRLRAAGRQPQGAARHAGQLHPHRRQRRLSADDRRRSAALRHAAVRARAEGRGDRRAGELRAQRVGQFGAAGQSAGRAQRALRPGRRSSSRLDPVRA